MFTHSVVLIVWVLFIPQFCSFEEFRIFFRIYTKKKIPNFLLSPQCENSPNWGGKKKKKSLFRSTYLEIKQNGSLDLKTNIHFHTQKGIGKKIVRSWVLIGNWGSVPHPLYGARISETDQPTRSILISICSLSSSALPQRYPGYGLRSLLSRVSLLRLSSCCCCLCCGGGGEGCCCCLCLSSPFHHRYHNSDVHRRVFSTKARILVLHFRSSFQIRCLSFHSDDGTTFVYVYISSPSCV